MKCTTDNYEILYSRWLQNPGKLLDWSAVKKGPVLDLCGGTGAVSKESVNRGLETFLVDLNPRCEDPRITLLKMDAHSISDIFQKDKFSVVICRQAMSYLNPDKIIPSIWEILKKDGVFVFNNFEKPRWKFSRYSFEGSKYCEISGHLGKSVFHLQYRKGFGVDFSKFKWHTHDELLKRLTPLFEVEVIHSGRSYRYRCTKK